MANATQLALPDVAATLTALGPLADDPRVAPHLHLRDATIGWAQIAAEPTWSTGRAVLGLAADLWTGVGIADTLAQVDGDTRRRLLFAIHLRFGEAL
ncbi:MAG: hypothetical protein QM757_14745 [Paludibaculum sp.]